jgi:hypothetical protein
MNLTARKQLQAALALSSALPFLLSLFNQAIWDDYKLLHERIAVTPASLAIFREPWFGGDAWRPLGFAFIYAETHLMRGWLPGMHLVNLLLHSLVCLTLFRFLTRLVGEMPAGIAALLFALHPAHAEAVGMIYGQLEMLAALFGLLALDRYAESIQSSRHSLQNLMAALGLVFLAACSKESGLMVPVLACLLRGFLLKPDEPWTSRWLTWREASLAAPVILYTTLRIGALGIFYNPSTAPITDGYSLAQRIKTVVVALGNLLRLTLFPTGQSLYYGHLRDHIVGRPWEEAAWIVCAALLCWWAWREVGGKAAAFGAGWFLAMLFPVLNILPSLVLVAERNLYFPLAGAAFLAGLLVYRFRPFSTAAQWGGAVLLLAMIVDGNLVVRQWRDSETMWRHTAATYPRSPMAQAQLGLILLNTPGKEAEAEERCRAAIELNPDLEDAKTCIATLAARGARTGLVIK